MILPNSVGSEAKNVLSTESAFFPPFYCELPSTFHKTLASAASTLAAAVVFDLL